MPILLKAISSENREVRREAFQTLQIIVQPSDLTCLVPLLQKPNEDIEKTIVIAANKQEPRKGRAREILLFLKTDQNDLSKAAAYRVLGQIGDPDSLDLLRSVLKSDHPILKQAAFRGLAEWPGPEVIDDMKRLITQGDDEKTKIIAFRAYVRMLRQSGIPSEKVVPELIGAMNMAPRESENKAVLAALGEQASDQALTAVVRYLDNSVLKAEAQAAVVGICENMVKKQPVMCKTALTKLLESNPNEIIRNRANELLQDLK